MTDQSHAASTQKGFDIACPKCGDNDKNIFIYLHELRSFHCTNCDQSFDAIHTASHFASQAKKWAAVADLVLVGMEITKKADTEGRAAFTHTVQCDLCPGRYTAAENVSRAAAEAEWVSAGWRRVGDITWRCPGCFAAYSKERSKS